MDFLKLQNARSAASFGRPTFALSAGAAIKTQAVGAFEARLQCSILAAWQDRINCELH
jgi:hypothetical protein